MLGGVVEKSGKLYGDWMSGMYAWINLGKNL